MYLLIDIINYSLLQHIPAILKPESVIGMLTCYFMRPWSIQRRTWVVHAGRPMPAPCLQSPVMGINLTNYRYKMNWYQMYYRIHVRGYVHWTKISPSLAYYRNIDFGENLIKFCQCIEVTVSDYPTCMYMYMQGVSSLSLFVVVVPTKSTNLMVAARWVAICICRFHKVWTREMTSLVIIQ